MTKPQKMTEVFTDIVINSDSFIIILSNIQSSRVFKINKPSGSTQVQHLNIIQRFSVKTGCHHGIYVNPCCHIGFPALSSQLVQ